MLGGGILDTSWKVQFTAVILVTKITILNPHQKIK